MNDNPEPQPLDPGLVRYLRLLVTVLTAVMIVGFIVTVFLFVTRFSQVSGPALPDVIALPDGTVPSAFTQGTDWYAVVTEDDRILVFSRKTGELRQSIEIRLEP